MNIETQIKAISKPKFPRSIALIAANEVYQFLLPVTERIIIAGSLRRNKQSVGDVEIVYVPQTYTVPDGLFDTLEVNKTDMHIDSMVKGKVLSPRHNVLLRTTWGKQNKLAVHCETGIPVDLFSTTKENWWNYLVCRTGSEATNIKIAEAARRKGWVWNPYSGFVDNHGAHVQAESERDVFELVGLPYLEPSER